MATAKRFALKTWVVFTVLVCTLPLLARSSDVLLLLPGFPGNSAQAQPYVDRMLRYLEKELRLDAGSMRGVFVTDGRKASDKLEAVKPGLALLGPSVYARNAGKMKMKVIARIKANGRGDQLYHVIVKKNGPNALQNLSGTVSGTVVHDDRFVLNVLWDGKVLSDKVTFKPNPRPLRALRGLAAGEVDAVIVDDETLKYMGDLDFADALKKIHSAAPVPAPCVVVMNDSISQAKKLKAALVGMCDGAEGKALCESLTISSVTTAEDRDYKALLKRYNR